ncbi:AI-2E family transporter [Ottowia flava]|uniref:AI-2E family transporter n=1 Tax=Ottowia flava TaxID=2675430 RepID=A0ABW4KV39_9BURK
MPEPIRSLATLAAPRTDAKDPGVLTAESASGAAPVRPPLMYGLVSAAVVVAALYFGRDMLMPLALAALLGFVLDPMVSWLKRRGLPRTVAVALVVTAAVALLAGAGWFIYGQMRQLANNLPAYENNINQKVRTIGKALRQPGMLDRYSRIADRFEREIETPAPKPAARATAPTQVEIVGQSESTSKRMLALLDKVATPLTMAGIVFVFVVLILLDKGDLRDRAVRLLGADLHRTTDALGDAARRVSKYLSMQLMVNATYGIPLAIGLLFIGIPGALVWGLLAAVLRFVPYVGPMIASIFPLALAFAVDPGWSVVLWTLALIITLEVISNNIVEPWLYGTSTGMSTLSLIMAAMFWTALWGPIGLILSTPITVVLLVLGHHLPQLQFLEVLLGSERALDEPTRLHQRLLAGDIEEASDLAIELADESSPLAFYYGVRLGTLRLASSAHGTVATAEHRMRVLSGMESVIEELREQYPPPPDLPTRVACFGGRWAVDVLAADMTAHVLALSGVGAKVVRVGTMSTEYFSELDLSGVEVVCLSYFSPDPTTLAKFFVRRLKRRWPDVSVILAAWHTNPDGPTAYPIEEIGADVLVTSLDELVAQARSRLSTTDAQPFAAAHLPEEENERLASLQASGLLAPALRGQFDKVAKRVADAFDCPMAEVLLVERDAELLHGSATTVGGDDDEPPEHAAERALSMAAHVVASGQPLIVPDVLRDARYATHPGLNERGIRFFAAAPLLDDAGRALGALCVMDTEARNLNHRDIMLLENLAADVVATAQMAREDWSQQATPGHPSAPTRTGPAEPAPA